ncbi:MAG: NUDIX domain-containing protein [Nitrospirae bacterium]|nr:NUDIX domain-containing protein [Nitrospirota bacterium]
MEQEEFLEIVNQKGEIVGHAKRSEIHGNPSLIHRVVHVLVFNKEGNLLLQKRSKNKDVAPGKWDTSVGGHVGIGEDLIFSSKREMQEELGIVGCEPEFIYSYIHGNHYETELVTTYRCVYDGTISFNEREIDEVRFWKLEEIMENLGKKIFSDNFENEFITYLNYSGMVNHL